MSQREQRGGGDVAALVVALVLAIPVAIALLTTAIAGLLADGHPIALGVGGALGVLVRLPGTLAHPRARLAQPRFVEQLPGASRCRSSSSSRRCSCSAPSRCCSVLVARHLHRRDAGDRAARWASRGELADLHVRPAAGGADHPRRASTAS